MDDLLVVGHLCEDVLPAPEAVASAVRGALVDAAPGGQEPPAYRRTGNDDGLLARLASCSRPLTASGWRNGVA